MSSIQSKAFFFLAKRSYFSKELKEKLLSKGFDQAEVELMIQKLQQDGWLNDEELAQQYVLRLEEKGYGAQWIAKKLRQKAGKVCISISGGDILSVIKKKYLKKLPERRDQVVRALMQRGFSYDLIDQALKSIKEQMESST